MSTVIALAGRRIDAATTQPARFPLQRVAAVTLAFRALAREEQAVALVCSAACGADIIALEVALELGLRTRIVLPFAAQHFRTTSVLDRPGDWGPRFDAVVSAALRHDDVVDLAQPLTAADAAYEAATCAIFEHTRLLASAAGAQMLAVAVWEGRPRAGADATQDFVTRAHKSQLRLRSLATLADT
jgi:hypothetical protein